MIFKGMEIPDEIYEAFQRLKEKSYEAAEALLDFFRSSLSTIDIIKALHQIAEEWSMAVMRSSHKLRLRPSYKSNLLAGHRWYTYECNSREVRLPYRQRIF